jgi:hypothetical protein
MEGSGHGADGYPEGQKGTIRGRPGVGLPPAAAGEQGRGRWALAQAKVHGWPLRNARGQESGDGRRIDIRPGQPIFLPGNGFCLD